MKAVLEFDLPADDDVYDAAAHALEYRAALWDIDEWARGQLKYAVLTDDAKQHLEELRSMIPPHIRDI